MSVLALRSNLGNNVRCSGESAIYKGRIYMGYAIMIELKLFRHSAVAFSSLLYITLENYTIFVKS